MAEDNGDRKACDVFVLRVTCNAQTLNRRMLVQAQIDYLLKNLAKSYERCGLN